MQKDFGRMMRNLVRLHGLDDRQVVDDFGGVRQQFRNLGARIRRIGGISHAIPEGLDAAP